MNDLLIDLLRNWFEQGEKKPERVWHYTITGVLPLILASGEIKTTLASASSRGLVWLSVNEQYEYGAFYSFYRARVGQVGPFGKSSSGRYTRLHLNDSEQAVMFKRAEDYYPARIEISPEVAPHRWRDVASIIPPMNRHSDEKLHRWKTTEWRFSFEPIKVSDWLTVETRDIYGRWRTWPGWIEHQKTGGRYEHKPIT